MLAKSKMPALFVALAISFALLRWPAQPHAQPPANVASFAEMRWRPIGPFRDGRTKAIAGVRGQPNVFCKSTDAGKSWTHLGLRDGHVLSKDENTGASDLESDSRTPDVVYAGLWQPRQGR